MKKYGLTFSLILFLASPGFGDDTENLIRIRAVGDIMLGALNPDGFLRPDEKGSILTHVRPLLQDAHITMGNLEGTLCDNGITEKCDPDSLDCYVFRMPEAYGDDLKDAGFDIMSLANNHVGDFGPECVQRTEEILDSLDIGWSGRPGTFSSVMVRGTRIGFIALLVINITSPALFHVMGIVLLVVISLNNTDNR